MIRIGREIQCLPYAGFLCVFLECIDTLFVALEHQFMLQLFHIFIFPLSWIGCPCPFLAFLFVMFKL